jgi:hypothetical protein
MLAEIIKSAQMQVKERISSPLMGSFIVSWCLWNYKFLVILFSTASVLQTFKLIDTVAFPNVSSLFLQGFLFPTLTAATYIFIYPYPAKYVYEFTRNRQKEINYIRQRIEDETPLTLEESREIQSEILRREDEHTQEIDRKNAEIKRLKVEVARYHASTEKGADSPNMKSTITLEPTQLELLRKVEAYQGKAQEKMLISTSAESQVKTEYDLGELVQAGLLTRSLNRTIGDFIYQFSHEGRSYLLNHGAALDN